MSDIPRARKTLLAALDLDDINECKHWVRMALNLMTRKSPAFRVEHDAEPMTDHKRKRARNLRRKASHCAPSPSPSIPTSAASPKPSTASATASETSARLTNKWLNPGPTLHGICQRRMQLSCCQYSQQIDQWFYLQAQSEAGGTKAPYHR